jgi:hypothetical protein
MRQTSADGVDFIGARIVPNSVSFGKAVNIIQSGETDSRSALRDHAAGITRIKNFVTAPFCFEIA